MTRTGTLLSGRPFSFVSNVGKPDMRRAGGSGCYRNLLFAFLASLCDFHLAETLTVTVEQKMTAHLATDVIIPCNISGYRMPELDTTKTAVVWYRRTNEERTESVLFSLISEEQESRRNGTRMNVDDLRKGNAALFLPQIQLNEGGTYRCVVTVTPSKAEARSIVEIVAQPVVTLSPKDVILEEGKATTLTCSVERFYPVSIEIYWEKYSKHTSHQLVSAADICTQTSVQNGDGTFSVNSKLSLIASSEIDGHSYSCIVKHKSFTTSAVFSTTVEVTGPITIIAWTIGLIALCLNFGVVLSTILYRFCFKTVPPQVKTLIEENTELKHLEKAKIWYLFSGFRPPNLDLNVFLTTPSYGKKKIFFWKTPSTSDPEKDGEEYAPLLGQWKDMFTFDLKLQPKQGRTFDLSCLIVIVPDVRKLDKFNLSLEVKHDGFQGGLHSETKQFRVIALPILDKILCSTEVPRGDDLLKLSCRIHSYFPEKIEVDWCPVPSNSQQSASIRDSDGLFFCDCTVSYQPHRTDLGKTFSCKAKLKDSKQSKESSWKMKLLVFPPQISQIQCMPAVPECGENVTLSCVVSNFYPPHCDVLWKKGLELLTDGTIKTGEPQLDNTSNLYWMESQVSFIPNAKDHGVDISVDVKHKITPASFPETISSNKYQFILKGFPNVKGITCEPWDIEYGSNLTLSCEVMDFHPKDITVQWFNGDHSIRDGVATVLETSGGFFKLLSMFQFIPTALDFDKTVSFRVMHEKLTKPITKEIQLHLPVKTPVLSEIKETSAPGRNTICLELLISDFAPCDISTVWYKDWEKISEDNICGNIQIGENKLGFFISKVEFTPKLEDFAKTISCEVSHQKQIQEKHFKLVQDSYDGLRQISKLPLNQNSIRPLKTPRSLGRDFKNPMKVECITSNPRQQDKVTLRCFVPGRRANETYVSWFKGLYPVDEPIENKDCEDSSGFFSYVSIATEDTISEYNIRCEVDMDGETLEEIFILKLK